MSCFISLIPYQHLLSFATDCGPIETLTPPSLVPSPSYAPGERLRVWGIVHIRLVPVRNFQAPIRLQYTAHDSSRTYRMQLISCNVSNIQSRNAHDALTKNIQLLTMLCMGHAFHWDVHDSPDPFSCVHEEGWAGDLIPPQITLPVLCIFTACYHNQIDNSYCTVVVRVLCIVCCLPF